VKKDKPRTLLIHDFVGYAFTIQLAELLGDGVQYAYCATYASPKGDSTGSRIPVHAIHTSRGFEKYGPRRILSEIEYGLRAAALVLRNRRATVVSANCPIVSQLILFLATRLVGGSFVFWLQDIFGLALNSDRFERERRSYKLAARGIGAIERFLLRHSNRVVCISQEFANYVEGLGVQPSKIEILRNWGDIHAVSPGGRENPWSASVGLTKHPRFVYSGTLGLKHDHTLLLDLARALAGVGGELVVVTEGVGADRLAADRADLPLTLLPYQDARQVTNVLASADVLVVLLEADATEYSVPSKVTTYLCAGRPILGSLSVRNDAARRILEAGAGVIVDPDDRHGFIREALALCSADASQREQMGQRGRAYAEREFAPAAITAAFRQAVVASSGHHRLDLVSRAQ
jgi:colanic acid biosynthesis glycosyl transferase WcaI